MAYPNLPWVHVIEWQFLMILNLNVRHSSSFNFKLHRVVLSNILLNHGEKNVENSIFKYHSFITVYLISCKRKINVS